MIRVMPKDKRAETAILLMDRGHEDLQLLRSVLRRVGFAVVHSEKGGDVLPWAAGSDAPLRLVVADPATPNLNLPQFVDELHHTAPGIPVLCLSDEAAGSGVPGCTGHIGASLKRPFRKARLLAAILEATEKPLARTA